MEVVHKANSKLGMKEWVMEISKFVQKGYIYVIGIDFVPIRYVPRLWPRRFVGRTHGKANVQCTHISIHFSQVVLDIMYKC